MQCNVLHYAVIIFRVINIHACIYYGVKIAKHLALLCFYSQCVSVSVFVLNYGIYSTASLCRLV